MGPHNSQIAMFPHVVFCHLGWLWPRFRSWTSWSFYPAEFQIVSACKCLDMFGTFRTVKKVHQLPLPNWQERLACLLPVLGFSPAMKDFFTLPHPPTHTHHTLITLHLVIFSTRDPRHNLHLADNIAVDTAVSAILTRSQRLKVASFFAVQSGRTHLLKIGHLPTLPAGWISPVGSLAGSTGCPSKITGIKVFRQWQKQQRLTSCLCFQQVNTMPKCLEICWIHLNLSFYDSYFGDWMRVEEDFGWSKHWSESLRNTAIFGENHGKSMGPSQSDQEFGSCLLALTAKNMLQ